MADIKITIIDREGVPHEVMAPTDMAMTLMELVKAYELAPEGTFGICGGMLMCSSCHCYIQSDEKDLPEMQIDEESLLYSEGTDIKDNSRLSCQLPITEEMEGLVIRIAPDPTAG